uniref:SH3b domain-containing protein n=1 Tax=uncultured bacterium 5E7 TaxID=1701324 RepID=A0A0N9HH27_9BACT|nr:hypothetical protein 5E7_008 [uncultured bacterium 5E7]
MIQITAPGACCVNAAPSVAQAFALAGIRNASRLPPKRRGMKALVLLPVLAGWLVVWLGVQLLADLSGLGLEQASPSTEHVACSIMVDSAAVRTEPVADSPVIGELQKPTVVTVIETDKSGTWRHVSGADWEGWVRGADLSPPYLVGPMTQPHLEWPRS